MIDFGHGVTLGPLDRSVSDEIRGWRNSYSIWKWCRQHKPISDISHEKWLERQDADSSIQMFSILFDSRCVGICGLTSIDLVNGHAEFSLYIAPGKHGNGYGKAALRTLTDYGFEMLRLNHIFGETFDGNPAVEMFLKVGYKKDGTRRGFYFREGKYINAHLYSITRDDWDSLLLGGVREGVKYSGTGCNRQPVFDDQHADVSNFESRIRQGCQ